MADGHVTLKVHKNFEICIVFLYDLEGFEFVWSLGDRLVGGGLGQKFEFVGNGPKANFEQSRLDFVRHLKIPL